MKLLTFIDQESTESYQQILVMALISGVANGLLLTIVNHAADQVAKGEDLTQFFILYLLAFLLFLYGQWFAFAQAIVAIESALHNNRLRLVNKIRQVELSFMESLGQHDLHAQLTQNNALLSQAIPQITSAAQVSILLVFALLYLAFISPLSFLLMVAAIAAGMMLFMAQSHWIKQELLVGKQQEQQAFALLAHLLQGFKEIRLNRLKNAAIIQDISVSSQLAKATRIEAGRQEVKMWGFGRVFIYAIMPLLLFIIPNFDPTQTGNIFKITATLLFMTGPISILVNSLPLLNRITLAIDDLHQLEALMNQATPDQANEQATPLPTDFQRIVLDDLSFTYPNGNGDSFTIGPLQQTFHAGELVFIIGSNGSGKSTFLKLLTGLYYPSSGTIQVDEQCIQADNQQAYRELFSTVFTDFHLFDKLYGLETLDPAQVAYWLEKMQLQHKVQWQNGGFTTTNLSTGQRKRLAFIAAVLEDKPILVLDEFAADQDPNFREYFYQTLLQELKAAGKTIIAVTHDDHYFQVAERVIKMDEGQLASYSRMLKAAAAEV